jgi:DNA repair exonuclease SbcCD nuclease subunit
VKVAILADTHWGIRGDDPNVRELQAKFMSEVFLPEIRKRGITEVVHLGDLFDRRKYVNYVTARACWTNLVSPLEQMGVLTHYLVGNHDTYYRNTNEHNSIQTLYGNGTNIRVYHDPMDVDVGGLGVLMAPWICDVNREATTDLLRTSRSRVVLGHLDLVGFEMYRGQIRDHGDDPAAFGRFDLVLSGHFHTRSRQGNIEYIGSTGQYAWSDHGDERGFVVLDTETLGMEFVPNPYEAFLKIVYDDSTGDHEAVLRELSSQATAGKFVKLVVKSKTDPYLLEKVIDSVEAKGVLDLKVVDDARPEVQESHRVETTDTLEVLLSMVDELPDVDLPPARRLIEELYAEATVRT